MSQGQPEQQKASSHLCLHPPRLDPQVSLPAHPLPQEPTPGPRVASILLRSRLWPAPTLSFSSCCLPSRLVFVNCSDLHMRPWAEQRRTCEQQLLNLSVPARGPCLSGCACPQGYVSVLPWVSIPERLAEPGTTGVSEGRSLTQSCRSANPGLPRYSVITSEESEKEQE